MLKYLTFFILIMANVCCGATFTSTQTGNWNDGATWGNTSPGVEGTDYPSTAGGDTVTISSGHEITIPSGYSALSSGVMEDATTGAHSKLIIAGSLKLEADFAINDWCELTLSAGSTLDLDGHDVTFGHENQDYLWFNFAGTSESHVTIKSTTYGGRFLQTTYGVCLNVSATYSDISDLGDSIFSSSSTLNSKAICEWDHCTFSNYGQMYLSQSNRDDHEFTVQNCDFGTPYATDKRIYFSATTAKAGTETRLVKNCTFSSTSNKGEIFLDADGVLFDNNIVSGFFCYPAEPNVKVSNSFFYNNSVAANSFYTSGGEYNIQNCYFFSDILNSHTINGSTISPNIISFNIFEQGVVSGSEPNFIFINDSTYTITNNIVIGRGTLVTALSSIGGTHNVNKNTIYGSTGAISLPLLLCTESSGFLTGTHNFKSNLVVDSDTTSNDYGIALRVDDANQITSVDYNCFYGYTGGSFYDAYNNVVFDPAKVEGTDADFGGSDIAVDPLFKNKNVTLATWDTSLGGSGTATNAITELLKLNKSDYNSDYNVPDLLAYIRDGFTPTNTALQGTGYDGNDIGAVDVSSSASGNPAALLIGGI